MGSLGHWQQRIRKVNGGKPVSERSTGSPVVKSKAREMVRHTCSNTACCWRVTEEVSAGQRPSIVGFKGGWEALCLPPTPGKEGPLLFPSRGVRALSQAPLPATEKHLGMKTPGCPYNHRCSELGLEPDGCYRDHPAPPPRPSDAHAAPAAAPPGTSFPINASSVAWAWEGGPGNAMGPSQPGPFSGWHRAGLLGTDLGGLRGHFSTHRA